MKRNGRIFLYMLIAVTLCALLELQCAVITRNPFLIPSKNYPDEVIATAHVGETTGEQISFVQVKGKIRCIKRKTPSTWES